MAKKKKEPDEPKYTCKNCGRDLTALVTKSTVSFFCGKCKGWTDIREPKVTIKPVVQESKKKGGKKNVDEQDGTLSHS